jgi:hypothetical protein
VRTIQSSHRHAATFPKKTNGWPFIQMTRFRESSPPFQIDRQPFILRQQNGDTFMTDSPALVNFPTQNHDV